MGNTNLATFPQYINACGFGITSSTVTYRINAWASSNCGSSQIQTYKCMCVTVTHNWWEYLQFLFYDRLTNASESFSIRLKLIWDKMCNGRTQAQSNTFKRSRSERDSEGSHCQTDRKNSGFNKATHPSSEGSWGNSSWRRQQSNTSLGCLGNVFWPSVNDSAFVWSRPHQQRDAQICPVISVTQWTPQKHEVSRRGRRRTNLAVRWALSRHCLCEPCN